MKKNITINLCGRLYQIDEDAYEILQQYINSLRSVFGKSEGGDEIVDDIEARIGELFDELKQNGIEAITIDHVKEIIVRIGEPEQLAGDDETSEPKTTVNEPKSGKANDKIIAGVMSRLAAKFGGKVLHWRIGFILLVLLTDFVLFPFFRIQHYPGSATFVFLLNFIYLAIYIVLAILLPKKTDQQQNASGGDLKSRKLFRNPNDKIVAGVLSGLAERFGGKVIMWRVCFILLLICTNFIMFPIFKTLHLSSIGAFLNLWIIIYAILAIALPEAQTPGQRLQMSGKPVTPKNLATVVAEGEQPKPRRGFFGRIFAFLIKTVVGITTFAVCIGCIVGCLIVLIWISSTIVIFSLPDYMSTDLQIGIDQMALTGVWGKHPILIIVAAISVLVLLAISIFATIRLILMLIGKIQPMGIGKRIMLIVLWITALCCLLPTGYAIAHYIGENRNYVMEHTEKYPNHSPVMWYKDGIWVTCDGKYIYNDVPMNEISANYLKNSHLTITKHLNCGESFAAKGEYYVGNGNSTYFEVRNDTIPPICQIEYRSEWNHGPGNGMISVDARAQGHGVYLFAALASSPDHPIAMTEIPPYGNKGGERWQRGLESNNGKGYGWSRVNLEFELEHNDTIIYGMTSDSTFTGKPCESLWFSNDGFSLVMSGGHKRKSPVYEESAQ